MSAEASGYVTSLSECPDRAPLTAYQKLVLFCLADHHNRSSRRCDPSQELLIRESLTSKDTVQRCLAYLEEHLVIEIFRPENQGRGQRTNYSFLILDNPAKLEELLAQRKGVQNDPLSKGELGDPLLKGGLGDPLLAERGAKGEHPAVKRGAKGEHPAVRNKEEPITGIEPITGATKNPKLKNPWERVLSYLQQELDPSSFLTWLAPTKLSHIDKGVIFVKIPSPDFLVIGDRYGDRIGDAIRRLGYEFTEVEFLVAHGQA